MLHEKQSVSVFWSQCDYATVPTVLLTPLYAAFGLSEEKACMTSGKANTQQTLTHT